MDTKFQKEYNCSLCPEFWFAFSLRIFSSLSVLTRSWHPVTHASHEITGIHVPLKICVPSHILMSVAAMMSLQVVLALWQRTQDFTLCYAWQEAACGSVGDDSAFCKGKGPTQCFWLAIPMENMELAGKTNARAEDPLLLGGIITFHKELSLPAELNFNSVKAVYKAWAPSNKIGLTFE